MATGLNKLGVWGKVGSFVFIHNLLNGGGGSLAVSEALTVILKSLTVVDKGIGRIEFFKLFKGLCLCLHD
jgi:hypothetical protein